MPGPIGETVAVFERSRRKVAASIVLPTVLGGFALACASSIVIRQASEGQFPPASILLAAGLCFAAAYAAAVSWKALHERHPRLVVGEHGLRLEGPAHEQWALWSSLSEFTEQRRRMVSFGQAGITGNGASGWLRQRGVLAVPDRFEADLATVVDTANTWRGFAIRAAPGVPEPGTFIDAETRFGIERYRLPWVTLAISAALIAIFAVEAHFDDGATNAGADLGVGSLQSFGGSSRDAVLVQGEWWRLITATLLHGSATHVLSNVIALLLVGWLFERLVGRLWFFALFCLGGLGGSLASIAFNAGNVVSVGASGAIMALFAASFTASFRLPRGTAVRAAMQWRSLRVLVPSLVPIASVSGAGVDLSAHAGGAVVGAATGLLLWLCWPETERLPPFRRAAAGVALAGGLLILASSVAAAVGYANRRATLPMPTALWPQTEAAADAAAPDLVRRYPGDPYAHALLGRTYRRNGNPAASDELRRAAVLIDQAVPDMDVAAEHQLRVFIAGQLLLDGERSAAAVVAWPTCEARRTPGLAPQSLAWLERSGLCAGATP